MSVSARVEWGPVQPAPTGRIPAVDVVRGLAVVLMLLDHVLAIVEPQSSLRVGAPWSITRLSLPLFMLAAACVWRPFPAGRRSRLRLLPAVVAEFLLSVALGGVLGVPGILFVFLLVMLLLDCFATLELNPSWWLLAALGFVQALYVPLGWSGYEVGLVLGWFALGRLALTERPPVPWRLGWLPGRRVLAFIGRHPLAFYVGHLVALLPLYEAVA